MMYHKNFRLAEKLVDFLVVFPPIIESKTDQLIAALRKLLFAP